MNRKAAIAEYKNRKTPRGTFVVRFSDEGRAWVDATPDLDAARNSLLFSLRHGLHLNKELQGSGMLMGKARSATRCWRNWRTIFRRWRGGIY
jgi:hypothetical protein